MFTVCCYTARFGLSSARHLPSAANSWGEPVSWGKGVCTFLTHLWTPLCDSYNHPHFVWQLMLVATPPRMLPDTPPGTKYPVMTSLSSSPVNWPFRSSECKTPPPKGAKATVKVSDYDESWEGSSCSGASRTPTDEEVEEIRLLMAEGAEASAKRGPPSETKFVHKIDLTVEPPDAIPMQAYPDTDTDE